MSIALNENFQIGHNLQNHIPKNAEADFRLAKQLRSSILARHVSYLALSGETAVIRPAAPADKLAVARLLARGSVQEALAESADQARRRRQGRILDAIQSMQDPMSIVHVVEIENRICAAGCVKVADRHRLFASQPVLAASGLRFDPDLALRLAEHVVRCCNDDGWPTLHYFADFADLPSAQRFAQHFRQRRVAALAAEAWPGLIDRLRYPRRSHRISFTFVKGP